MEVPSRTHCWRGKATIIPYSECVYVCSRSYPARLWPSCLYLIFPHRLTNGKIFVKTLLNIKNVFLLSVRVSSETFLIISIIQQDIIIKKVKWSRHRPGLPQSMGRGIALLFHDRGTRRGWVVSSTPRPHFTPRGKTRYPLYRRLGGPQGRSGRAEILVSIGIRSRTIQPVVSRYTDWATRA